MAPMLTSKQVAFELGVSSATVRSWRHRGTGPKFERPGGKGAQVFYKPAEVAAYKEKNHDRRKRQGSGDAA